jgi:transcriptional coactivator HFI1/ADA1
MTTTSENAAEATTTATPSSIMNGSANPAAATTTTQGPAEEGGGVTNNVENSEVNNVNGDQTPKLGKSKRIEMDSMMAEFQKNLGSNWDRYRDVITLFLIGKLTRGELQQELDQILDKSMIKMHNRFLLANFANALRDGPQGENGMLTAWSKKSKDSSRNVKGDTQLAKLKQDIMELSVRERKRIKAIAKESGKKAPVPSTITSTRQAMLPKIPFINDKEKLLAQQQKASQMQAQTNVQTPTPSQIPQQQTQQQQNAATTNNTNPVAWTQDIIHAYETPLASEAYELPDQDALTTRMLGISLEHGLLQGVDRQCPEVLQIALEQYLRDLVQQVVDTVQWRKKPGENILTAEDLSRVLESSATSFVEPSGPTYRLQDVVLTDEDTLMEDAPPQSKPGQNTANNENAGLNNLLNEILSS